MRCPPTVPPLTSSSLAILLFAAASSSLIGGGIEAFAVLPPPKTTIPPTVSKRSFRRSHRAADIFFAASAARYATGDEDGSSGEYDYSTLTHIDHIRIDIPYRDVEYAAPFYLSLLGCSNVNDHWSVDSIQAEEGSRNGNEGRAVLCARCGPSRFIIRICGDDDDAAASAGGQFPGHFGLRYDSLEGLKGRLKKVEEGGNEDGRCYSEATIGIDRSGRDCVKLSDWSGNSFVCRASSPPSARNWPVASPNRNNDDAVATDCHGINYVEFLVPRGVASRISTFYDCVFDATTTIVRDGDDDVAIVGCGALNPATGRADQTLLFRESDEEIPPHVGERHGIGLYVGSSQADFEHAWVNCREAGVVAAAATPEGAQERRRRFLFKDVVDLRSGGTVFELEHEVMSVEDGCWTSG